MNGSERRCRMRMITLITEPFGGGGGEGGVDITFESVLSISFDPFMSAFPFPFPFASFSSMTFDCSSGERRAFGVARLIASS